MHLSAHRETFGNRIGERLYRKGMIPREVIDKAVAIQREERPELRRKLGDILINEFKIDRHLVYREIAEMYAFPEIDLTGIALKDGVAASIKQFYSLLDPNLRKILRNKAIIPYKPHPNGGSVLCIATADTTCPEIADIAAALGFMRYEVQYCRCETIQTLIERLLPVTNDFLRDYENTPEEPEQQTGAAAEVNEGELDREIHRSKLTNLIEGCFVEAVRKGASDIHFVPRTGRKVEIFFRIDGKLMLWHTQTGTQAEAVAAVLKDRSKNVNRFEREIAQDGFFQRTVDGCVIRFRVSILPVVGVEYERKLESVVVRILDDRKVIGNLKELGLLKKAYDDFSSAIAQPQGMVILTGPTGSGKSTTLMASLGTVMTPEVNVLTVEEPVEYLVAGARQILINPKLGFDMAMRSILRHDPDIVMVGEMRDRATAEIAFKLANTGHLTFSTLHTNDAVSVISRLYKIGIEPFLIAHAVNIVVAQRLVRKLCPRCKQIDRDIDPAVPRALGFSEQEIHGTVFYKPTGGETNTCTACHGGFSGRLAIHEALLFTRAIRRAILDMSDSIDEDRLKEMACENGMLTLRASGRERIKTGETTCAEVAFATAADRNRR